MHKFNQCDKLGIEKRHDRMSSHQASNKCKDDLMKLMIKREDFYDIYQL